MAAHGAARSLRSYRFKEGVDGRHSTHNQHRADALRACCTAVRHRRGPRRPIWGVLRLSMGWIFLWAFLDKLLALGFATGRNPETGVADRFGDAAWIYGGSPTDGFLKFGLHTKEPFTGFYEGLVGSTFIEWVYMLSMAAIGIALLLGIATRLAAGSGILWMLLFYTASALSPENNPFLDDHIVYAIVLVGIAVVGAGATWASAAAGSSLELRPEVPDPPLSAADRGARPPSRAALHDEAPPGASSSFAWRTTDARPVDAPDGAGAGAPVRSRHVRTSHPTPNLATRPSATRCTAASSPARPMRASPPSPPPWPPTPFHAAVMLAPAPDSARSSSPTSTSSAPRWAAGLDGTAAEIAREPMAAIAPSSSARARRRADGEARRRASARLRARRRMAGRRPLEPRRRRRAGRPRPWLTRIVRPGPARPLVSATALAATTVGAVMHPGVVTCLPDTPLEPVAGTMADLRMHCVAVAGVGRGDDGDEHFVWGLVSDMDVLHAALPRRAVAARGRFAAASPLALPATAGLDRAAALMAEHEATHVVVVGRSGLPAGVVSTLDVLRIVAAG